jgi:DNA recombination protein RmuC
MSTDVVTVLLLVVLALLAGFGLGFALGRSRSDERFHGLADAALRRNTEQFLTVAAERLSSTEREQSAALDPVQGTLTRVEAQLRALELERERAYQQLSAQVADARRVTETLQGQTASLVTALSAPRSRGRWGEVQLRRVVELAGMSEHVSFTEQHQLTVDGRTLRPDLVVHLPGGRHCIVDAKVPLDAYLRAAETSQPQERDALHQQHARALRDHVRTLSSRAYWRALDGSPDFVVLFVPGEAFLAAAFEADPGLAEEAMGAKVVIATPQTLVATLHAASYAWQQDALAEHAQEVFALGRELAERLRAFTSHLGAVGSKLAAAVDSHNKAVGSLESRVLVTARRLDDFGVSSGALDPPQPVDVRPRQPALRVVPGGDALDVGGSGDDGSGAAGAVEPDAASEAGPRLEPSGAEVDDPMPGTGTA